MVIDVIVFLIDMFSEVMIVVLVVMEEQCVLISSFFGFVE